jgi:hypothetical protein
VEYWRKVTKLQQTLASQKTAKSLPKADLTGGTSHFRARFDHAILQSLVISFCVKMGQEVEGQELQHGSAAKGC